MATEDEFEVVVSLSSLLSTSSMDLKELTQQLIKLQDNLKQSYHQIETIVTVNFLLPPSTSLTTLNHVRAILLKPIRYGRGIVRFTVETGDATQLYHSDSHKMRSLQPGQPVQPKRAFIFAATRRLDGSLEGEDFKSLCSKFTQIPEVISESIESDSQRIRGVISIGGVPTYESVPKSRKKSGYTLPYLITSPPQPYLPFLIFASPREVRGATTTKQSLLDSLKSSLEVALRYGMAPRLVYHCATYDKLPHVLKSHEEQCARTPKSVRYPMTASRTLRYYTCVSMDELELNPHLLGYDADVVIVKDLYPKGNTHALILPRILIDAPAFLIKDDLPLLKRMYRMATALVTMLRQVMAGRYVLSHRNICQDVEEFIRQHVNARIKAHSPNVANNNNNNTNNKNNNDYNDRKEANAEGEEKKGKPEDEIEDDYRDEFSDDGDVYVRSDLPRMCQFSIGFHAIPYMQQLHLHIVSRDHCGVTMNAHNWITYSTEYFVPISKLIHTLGTEGVLPNIVDSPRAYQLLNDDFRFKCDDKTFSNMEDLNDYLHERAPSDERRAKDQGFITRDFGYHQDIFSRNDNNVTTEKHEEKSLGGARIRPITISTPNMAPLTNISTTNSANVLTTNGQAGGGNAEGGGLKRLFMFLKRVFNYPGNEKEKDRRQGEGEGEGEGERSEKGKEKEKHGTQKDLEQRDPVKPIAKSTRKDAMNRDEDKPDYTR